MDRPQRPAAVWRRGRRTKYGRFMEGGTSGSGSSEVRSRRTRGLGFVAVVAAIAGTGWLIGAGGWPGEPSGCIAAGDCSCEAFSSGLVVQPVNTFSNLALIGAGLWLVWLVPIGAVDRIRRLAYSSTVIGLGVGSAAFHASMTEWGGWMDLLGIHLFLGLVLVAGVAQFGDRSDRWILATISGGGVAVAAALWFMDNSLGKYTAALLVVAIALTEWRAAQRGVERDRGWLWLSIGLFAAGLGLQWLGRGGGAWCDPDVVFQPHALWHGVAALGAIALSRYLFPASDRRT